MYSLLLSYKCKSNKVQKFSILLFQTISNYIEHKILGHNKDAFCFKINNHVVEKLVSRKNKYEIYQFKLTSD